MISFPFEFYLRGKKGNMLNKLAIRDFVNRDFLKPKNSPAYQKRKKRGIIISPIFKMPIGLKEVRLKYVLYQKDRQKKLLVYEV